MFTRSIRQPKSPARPAESHGVMVIADRVVELETIHVGEAVWIAKGRVSEPLPSGPRLCSPVEITATAKTESAAITMLRHRVEELAGNRMA